MKIEATPMQLRHTAMSNLDSKTTFPVPLFVDDGRTRPITSCLRAKYQATRHSIRFGRISQSLATGSFGRVILYSVMEGRKAMTPEPTMQRIRRRGRPGRRMVR